MGILEGIGEHLSTGFKSVRDSERAKLAAPGIRNDASEVSQLLQTYRSIDPSQTEQRNQMLQRIVATPTFQKFQGNIGPLAQSQVDRTQATDKISKLALAGSRAEDFIDDNLKGAISNKIKEGFAELGIVSEASDTATGSQKVRLSSLFSDGEKALRKSAKGNIATPEETKAFADKFKADAAKMGVSPSAAAAIFGEKYDKEVGRKVLGTTMLKNDVFPQKSKASDYFAEAPVAKTASKLPDEKTVKAFEDFAQVATENFPTDNTPKPYAALGITEPADQQTMQELQQEAPKDLNIQSIAQQDPEAFKQILASLRKGKTPSGKPFTIKDALEMMGQL